jgi:tetratricopeptide (TPR) repeat protein
MYKRVTSFNLKNFDLGIEIYMDASALFSFSGFLFRLSGRILDSAKPNINKDNAKILINYDFLETILNYLQGNWKKIKEYDDDLVNRNLSIGEIYLTSQHLFWHGLPYVYQGFLDKARFIMNRLNEIIEVYENDFSILLKLELNIALLIECRMFHDALQEIERAIEITKKANFHMYLLDIYCYKIWIYSLMGEMEEADKNLTKANQLKNEVSTVPIILSTFYRSELELYMNRFRAAIRTGNRSSVQEYRKKVKKTGKLLMSVSQRASLYRTESYKLTGVYYWLINKQKKALKYWQRSIEAGEQLGARLELSRAYFEIGKRLLEPGSKYRELNGIKADEYLKKAKVLFEEMDLEWDLNEVNNVIKG